MEQYNEEIDQIDCADRKNLRWKNIYFESLFQTRGNSKNLQIICTNKYVTSVINSLYHKFPKTLSKRDFFNECMYYTYTLIQRFEIQDGGSWKGIIDGSDKPNIARLIDYITETLPKRIYDNVINSDKKATTRKLNGKKSEHVWQKLNILSLDSELIGYEGEETTLGKIVSNEQSFFANYKTSTWFFFIEWLNQNKDRILLKAQKEYLEQGVYEVRMHKRICEKLTNILTKENPFGKKSVRQLQKGYEIKLWTSLIDIVYCDDDYSSQNKMVSDWIVKNLDDDRVSNLIFDHLTGSEARLVVYAYYDPTLQIPSKILYKIYDLVEERLDQLQLIDTKSSNFYRKESEIGYWTKEKHEAYNRYYDKFKNNVCKKYDKYGQFISYCKEKPKKTVNIIISTPTGVELLTEIEQPKYDKNTKK